MSLFDELRQRNVVRVGISYVIVAWVVLQVAETIVPILGLPEGLLRAVLYLLVAGFPIALVLAWVYELTPAGLRKAAELSGDERQIQTSHRKFDLVIIGILAFGIVVLLVERFYLVDMGRDALADRRSIAVLPFDNMSDDPSQEHFAEGITEEILNVLAPIKALRVISRSSSFTFKDPAQTIPEIAKLLDVEYILEGSVRRAGDRVRITAQLIEAHTDTHVWSATYDEELTLENLLDVQEQVAVTVVAEMNATLLPEEAEGLDLAGPSSLEALDLYHDGMFYLRQIEVGAIEEPPFEQAIGKFEASIALDDQWAPSLAALARVHHFRMDLDVSEGYLERALAIDQEYGPAWISTAFIRNVRGDLDGAKQAYDRAAVAGADVNWGLAIYYLSLARFDDAVRHYRLAVADDPLSVTIRSQLAHASMCAGQYEDVVADLTELLPRHPENTQWWPRLAYAQVKTGDTEAALQSVERYAEAEGVEWPAVHVLALAGETERAEAAMASAVPEEVSNLRAYMTAAIVLGRTDEALDALESMSAPYRGMNYLLCTEEVRSLTGNPRFDRALELAGLSD